MAVRFLPERDPTGSSLRPDRDDLAEVIDLRTRLVHPVASDLTIDRVATELAGGSAAVDDSVDAGDPADAQAAAKSDAIRLLARRALSSGELARQLTVLGHDQQAVMVVVEEAGVSLYLDDRGLARVVSETMRERKQASRAQIRNKLRQRLLPDEVIDATVAELDTDDESALLRDAAQQRARRLGGLDRQTAERRLLGFSRGVGGQESRPCERPVRRSTVPHLTGVEARRRR